MENQNIENQNVKTGTDYGYLSWLALVLEAADKWLCGKKLEDYETENLEDALQIVVEVDLEDNDYLDEEELAAVNGWLKRGCKLSEGEISWYMDPTIEFMHKSYRDMIREELDKDGE